MLLEPVSTVLTATPFAQLGLTSANGHGGVTPRMHVLSLLGALLGLTGCARPGLPPVSEPASPVAAPGLSPSDALAAMAHLYGVVRWFHPSDEAAGADWDAVAVAGTTLAIEARTTDELQRGLLAVFGPLAPTLQIWHEGAAPPGACVAPGDGPVVAWQHLGWSFGGDQPIYRASRLGRSGLGITTNGAITATNGGEADDLRGRTIRVSARVRVEAQTSSGGFLWLRIDHGAQDETATRVGWDAPVVTDPVWRRYEVSTDVPLDATWYVFGVRLAGRGTLWADDFQAEVREADGTWRPVHVRDAGFEDRQRWWTFDGLGYDADVVEEGGDPALRLTHQDILRAALFDQAPSLGEAFEAPIGAGLVARVPLALPAGREHPAAAPLPALVPSRDDPPVRVAAAIVAWNVLRHFHPYEQELHVDWDGVLRSTITRALAADDRAALVDTVWGLMVDVPDGHAWVGHRAVTGRQCGVAFRWLRVGNDLVVTNSGDESIHVGDLVTAVNGEPTATALRGAVEHVSGSPQFREAFAAERLATAPCGTPLSLQVDRAGAPVSLAVDHQGGAPPLFDHPGVEDAPGGVLLVDLNTVPWDDLDLDALASARAVVFDLREYPANGALHVIEHLLSRPDRARAWMRVPEIIRPGQVAGWEMHEWGLAPAKPPLRGEAVFLTSALAISATESILALVKAEGLATLVGARTAGTNGNATGAVLPGGYWIQFTGMRVVHPDGAPFHLVGVAPDVEASPTLAGLRAGRDEVRDAAVAWLEAR